MSFKSADLIIQSVGLLNIEDSAVQSQDNASAEMELEFQGGAPSGDGDVYDFDVSSQQLQPVEPFASTPFGGWCHMPVS
jgi:hypothetical protein